MENEIKVGDVVQLKSGGNPMTVAFVYPNGLCLCVCYYFDGKGELHKDQIQLSALKKY